MLYKCLLPKSCSFYVSEVIIDRSYTQIIYKILSNNQMDEKEYDTIEGDYQQNCKHCQTN